MTEFTSKWKLLEIHRKDKDLALDIFLREREEHGFSNQPSVWQNRLMTGGGRCGSFQYLTRARLQGRRYVVGWSDDAPSVTWLDECFSNMDWCLMDQLPLDFERLVRKEFPNIDKEPAHAKVQSTAA